MTRRSPAAASAAAFCGSSAPFVVRVEVEAADRREPLDRSSRSRRSSGSPPVIRIFSTPSATNARASRSISSKVSSSLRSMKR